MKTHLSSSRLTEESSPRLEQRPCRSSVRINQSKAALSMAFCSTNSLFFGSSRKLLLRSHGGWGISSSSNSSTSRINYIYENTHTLSLSLFYAERIYSHIHLSFAEIFSSLSIETASSYFFYLTYQKGYYIHIGRV